MLYPDREARILAFLDALSIPYTLMHHGAVYTMDDCRDVPCKPDTAYCKNLFLANRQQTALYLLCLRGDQPFRSGDVSRQLGVSRLSFAPEALLPDCLGLLPGAVSALGLFFDGARRVQLVLDNAFLRCAHVAFHPCVNTATVVMPTQDFINTFLPAVSHVPRWVQIGPKDEECALI
jgi:Ala-tRNA(Pro) deacylase